MKIIFERFLLNLNRISEIYLYILEIIVQKLVKLYMSYILHIYFSHLKINLHIFYENQMDYKYQIREICKQLSNKEFYVSLILKLLMPRQKCLLYIERQEKVLLFRRKPQNSYIHSSKKVIAYVENYLKIWKQPFPNIMLYFLQKKIIYWPNCIWDMQFRCIYKVQA